MGHSNTTFLNLTKPENKDPDTYDIWDQPVNDNMDIIDAAFGSRVYTEKNYIIDSEAVSTSLDKLDMAVKDVADGQLTSDELAAVQGGDSPSAANPFATKSYVRVYQKITLVPEFAGAVLHASGANNTGDMTATYEDSTYRYSYYKWLSSEVTLQSYDINVQWRVPYTFVAWSGTAIRIDLCTQSNDALVNKVDATLTVDGALGTTSAKTAVVGTVGGTWYSDRANNALIYWTNGDSILSGLVGGELINLHIRMYSKDSNYVKVGNITLYLRC